MSLVNLILSFGLRCRTAITTCAETAICVVRVMLESRRNSFPSRAKSTTAYVLGAGPSLTADISKLMLLDRTSIDMFCVNDFYRSVYFEQLKPKHYVVADPDYWSERRYAELSKPLVEAIALAPWEVALWIPVTTRGSILDREAKKAQVTIYYFNKTPLSGALPICTFLFGRRLAMPRPQNVLVATIAIAMWMGYKEINLLGADHDWHKEIHVSEQNILQTRTRHSYEEQDTFRPFYKASSGLSEEPPGTFSVAEIFYAWALVHQSYELLQLLSLKFDVDIFNRGSSSFIDAFKRKKLQ